jgi:hypothetical protein
MIVSLVLRVGFASRFCESAVQSSDGRPDEGGGRGLDGLALSGIIYRSFHWKPPRPLTLALHTSTGTPSWAK